MKRAYTRTYNGLWLQHLTPEQHSRTCGYWYTVTSYGGTAHTAFTTKIEMDAKLSLLGLSPERELNKPDGCRIIGEYREAMYMNRDDFEQAEGLAVVWMSNGSYTDARVTIDEDGGRTVHYCNPNERRRPLYDYTQARARIHAGNLSLDGLAERERSAWEKGGAA